MYQLNQYDYDVRDNHTRGSAAVQTAVVGGPDKSDVGHGAATIKQRVAEKFRSAEDARYLSWHITKFTDQEYSSAPKDWRADVLQVSGYSKVVGRR